MKKGIPGIYALVLSLNRKKAITIGKLGRFTFEPGWYVYLGSAHAGGGVKARTDRHRRVEKKLRWNVDHFRPHAALTEIWFSHDVHERECQWAQALAGLRGASVPVDGFGSHDCDCCPAHLIRLDQRPVAQMLRHTLAAKYPEHEPIYVESLIPAEPSESESTMLQRYLRGNLYIEHRRRGVATALAEAAERA
ncbi:MAG: GIY-YIG nuclease family protein, partial [Phycisphaeraceae bacterium]